MDRDEAPGEQADEAVHVLEREARPALELSPPASSRPRTTDARAARRRGPRPRAPRTRCSSPRERQATRRLLVQRRSRRGSGRPRRRATKRPGSPRSSSQSGPSFESRKAAFAATSAATHEPAATVTSSQRESAGRPVRGSIRWCWSSPPRRQRRFVVPLVAIPPASSAASRRPEARRPLLRAWRRRRPRRPAVAGDQPQRRVDGERLDDAVQVERGPRRAREQARRETDLRQRPGTAARAAARRPRARRSRGRSRRPRSRRPASGRRDRRLRRPRRAPCAARRRRAARAPRPRKDPG